METVTIVGWTGAGSFSDLNATVLAKLGVSKGSRVSDTLVLENQEPVATARRLAQLPGVAWIAVGYRFSGENGHLGALAKLAPRYMRKGLRFKVSAHVTGSARSAGDLILASNSEILSMSKGAKIDERKPDVRFRVALDGQSGACGVQIREGGGGTPTGSSWVTCMVSGGKHSSAMSWMAALTGRSIRLVHSRADEPALRHVSRLYSELSFRMDPRRVRVVLLEGEGDPAGRLGAWLRDHKEISYVGSRPEGQDDIREFASRFPNLVFPLLLVDEGAVESVYRSLNLGREAAMGSGGGFKLGDVDRGSPYVEKTFGGKQADANVVLDALKAG